MMKRNGLFPALMTLFFGFNFSKAAAQNTSPYWSLAGNSNATAASKLGTTNNTPLRLFTNNGERLRIDPLGKVGIGTASPIGKLTVFNNGSTPVSTWTGSATPIFTGFSENKVGNADFILSMASNVNARSSVLLRRARGTLAAPVAVAANDYLGSLVGSGYDGAGFQNAAAINFGVDGTPSAGYLPASISLNTGSNTSNRQVRLHIGSTGNIAFNTSQLYLDNEWGNVGIGTTSPRAQLEVMVKNREIDDFDYPNNGIMATGHGIGVSGVGIGHGELSRDPIGVYGYAENGIGVEGRSLNRTGVKASGGTGVEAEGGLFGVFAKASSIAVYADGGYSGFEGGGKEYGVLVGSSNVGVFGNGGYNGVTGTGGEYGVMGVGNVAGIYGESESSTGFAGNFNGDVYASGTYQTSDKSLKQNVQELQNAMHIIGKLKPKHYEFKTNGRLEALHLPGGTHYGLVAQEVEAVLPNLVKEMHHDLNLSKRFRSIAVRDSGSRTAMPERRLKQDSIVKDIITIKAVNYTELIPIMIKGMQEQEATIAELEKKAAEVDELKEQIAALRQMVLDLKNGTNGTVTYTSAYLEQSSPNPVRGTTIIRYQVPTSSASARLTITNSKGQMVKTISIINKGAGQVNFNTAMLAAGTYSYTLWVDGKQADTKQLVVLR